MKLEIIGTTLCKKDDKEVQIVYGWDKDKWIFCGEANHYVNLDDLPPLYIQAKNEEDAKRIVRESLGQGS